LSDFYELKTACSRTIQNAELFISGRITVDTREKE